MVQYTGKSSLTHRLREKPTPKGLKAIVIAQRGYFYSWFWDPPGGYPHRLQRYFLKDYEFPKTQAVVIGLVNSLPPVRIRSNYHVFADNLFTMERLIRYLRQRNIGYTGTSRQPQHSGFKSKLHELYKADRDKDKIPFS